MTLISSTMGSVEHHLIVIAAVIATRTFMQTQSICIYNAFRVIRKGVHGIIAEALPAEETASYIKECMLTVHIYFCFVGYSSSIIILRSLMVHVLVTAMRSSTAGSAGTRVLTLLLIFCVAAASAQTADIRREHIELCDMQVNCITHEMRWEGQFMQIHSE